MSFVENFENKIESAVNGVFSRIGSKDIKPVDITSALQKEIDKQAIVITMGRTVVPNHFTVKLSTEDFDKVIAWGAQAFADELAANLTQYAGSQDYVLIGPITVIFSEDVELGQGDMVIASQSVRGTMPVGEENMNNERYTGSRNFTEDENQNTFKPILYVNKQPYVLNKEVTVIGRDSNCDIVVDDSGVSRQHAEIRVTPKGTIITDMGSTNGLYVEGHKVPAATLLDGNSIVIGRTKLYFKTEE